MSSMLRSLARGVARSNGTMHVYHRREKNRLLREAREKEAREKKTGLVERVKSLFQKKRTRRKVLAG